MHTKLTGDVEHLFTLLIFAGLDIWQLLSGLNVTVASKLKLVHKVEGVQKLNLTDTRYLPSELLIKEVKEHKQ